MSCFNIVKFSSGTGLLLFFGLYVIGTYIYLFVDVNKEIETDELYIKVRCPLSYKISDMYTYVDSTEYNIDSPFSATPIGIRMFKDKNKTPEKYINNLTSEKKKTNNKIISKDYKNKNDIFLRLHVTSKKNNEGIADGFTRAMKINDCMILIIGSKNKYNKMNYKKQIDIIKNIKIYSKIK